MPNYDPRWLKNPWDLDQGTAEDAPSAKIPSLQEELARQWLQNGPIQKPEAPKFDADAAAAQWFKPVSDMNGAGVSQAGAPELPKGVVPYTAPAAVQPASHILYKFPGDTDWQDAKKDPAPYTDPNGFGQSWTSSGGGTVSQPNADYQQYRRNLYGDAEVAAEDMAVAKNKALEQAYKQVSPTDLLGLGPKASDMVKVPTGGVDANGQPEYKYAPKQSAGTFTEPEKVGATLQARIVAGKAALDSEEAIAQELKDPKIIAALGPLSGRVSAVEQLMGTQEPELQKLVGLLHGYMLNTMGVHGMRNAQEAHNLFNQMAANKFTPESILAAIHGLNEVPRFYSKYNSPMQMQGVTPNISTPSTATSAPTAPTSQFRVVRKIS